MTQYNGFASLRDGRRLPALLTEEANDVQLTISFDGELGQIDDRNELGMALFESANRICTLIHLAETRSKFNSRGIWERAFSVWLSIADCDLFSSEREPVSKSWKFQIDGLRGVQSPSGLSMEILFEHEAQRARSYAFRYEPQESIKLDCGSSGFDLEFFEEASISPPAGDGMKIELRSGLLVASRNEISADQALEIADRLRNLFGIIIGADVRVTSGAVKLKLEEEAEPRYFPLLGPFRPPLAVNSHHRLLPVLSAKQVSRAVEIFFEGHDFLADPVALLLDGLSHRRAPAISRFQSLIQSVEGHHRRKTRSERPPFEFKEIRKAILAVDGVTNDWANRIIDACNFVAEPSLAVRLHSLCEEFLSEILVCFPELENPTARNKLVSRIVATRNYLFHRMLPSEKVLDGADLHNAAEFLKALAYLSLLKQLGLPAVGIGEAMNRTKFVAKAQLRSGPK